MNLPHTRDTLRQDMTKAAELASGYRMAGDHDLALAADRLRRSLASAIGAAAALQDLQERDAA